MTAFVRPIWASPLSVSSMLVIGPTEEPITLDQAKLAAGLDWPTGDPRDAQMTAFIKAARQLVEQRTSLALLTQTRDITIDACYTDVVPLPAQALPLQSLTDPAGVTFQRRELLIDMQRRVLTLPSVYDAAGAWTIVSGWPSPAALADEAPLLVHAVTLLTAHYATLGRDLASVDQTYQVPAGFEDAIAPFCRTWVI